MPIYHFLLHFFSYQYHQHQQQQHPKQNSRTKNNNIDEKINISIYNEETGDWKGLMMVMKTATNSAFRQLRHCLSSRNLLKNLTIFIFQYCPAASLIFCLSFILHSISEAQMNQFMLKKNFFLKRNVL